MQRAETIGPSDRFLILIPVYDDWEAVTILLKKLDDALHNYRGEAEVLLVDDGSSMSFDVSDLIGDGFTSIASVKRLELRRNVGHQRAIALGLAFVEDNLSCRAVVVMDGDGEDAPSDVPRLLEQCASEGYERVIFARRAKRGEGWSFRLFYVFYKLLFKLLTGQTIRVGNFSVIPKKLLSKLVSVSEVWNHYAVGAFKARVPCSEILTNRGTRLAGQPTTNFVSLTTHGLSAISVHGEAVGVRLLLGTLLLIAGSIVGIIIVVAIKLTTTLAIPGWATYVVGLLLIILMQAVSLSLFFSFIVLSGRNNSSFLPLRDYHYFISDLHTVFTKEQCITPTLVQNWRSSVEPATGKPIIDS